MPPPPKAMPAPNPSKKADDHSINNIYGQSLRKYPPDCPPLNVMWFHAVDVSLTGPSIRVLSKTNVQNPRSRKENHNS